MPLLYSTSPFCILHCDLPPTGKMLLQSDHSRKNILRRKTHSFLSLIVNLSGAIDSKLIRNIFKLETTCLNNSSLCYLDRPLSVFIRDLYRKSRLLYKNEYGEWMMRYGIGKIRIMRKYLHGIIVNDLMIIFFFLITCCNITWSATTNNVHQSNCHHFFVTINFVVFKWSKCSSNCNSFLKKKIIRKHWMIFLINQKH